MTRFQLAMALITSSLVPMVKQLSQQLQILESAIH